MHTVSYEFLMKPEESADSHQTLSPRVGSGHETNYSNDENKILNAILSAIWLLAAVTLCAISFFLNELA